MAPHVKISNLMSKSLIPWTLPAATPATFLPNLQEKTLPKRLNTDTVVPAATCNCMKNKFAKDMDQMPGFDVPLAILVFNYFGIIWL